MKIRELYTKSRIPLHEIDILLSHVLNKPKEYIYAHPDSDLTKLQLAKLQKLITRRQAGEPIAYLTGHKEFYGLDFFVTPAVLIPRPDTELLVEQVLKLNLKHQTILDVGTGSGNIAITLKHELPNCKMMATDISATALAVAKRNATHNHASITFFKSDVLANLPKSYHHTLDIITFNAPYLTKTEAKKANLQFEPQVALTPTGQPTELIERLLQQADQFLAPTGQIFFEIGYRQANQVKKLCQKYFPTAKLSVQQDLGGWDRLVRLDKTN